MKIVLILFRTYYRLLSFLSPKLAGKQAARLFQKARKKAPRSRELAFLEEARHHQLSEGAEPLHYYELGASENPVMFLVHGWESHAGSMGAIADRLVKQGYRVIAPDLPAHGKSALSHTNLPLMAEAFNSLINHIQPEGPVSVVSHSFGSAVTTYTLDQYPREIGKLVYLTSPNQIGDFMREFQQVIGLSEKGFELMVKHFEGIFGIDPSQIRIAELAKELPYQEFMIVHDQYDKVIPFANAVAFHNTLPNSQLVTAPNAGHYRMLWNPQVIKAVSDFMSVRSSSVRKFEQEEMALSA